MIFPFTPAGTEKFSIRIAVSAFDKILRSYKRIRITDLGQYTCNSLSGFTTEDFGSQFNFVSSCPSESICVEDLGHLVFGLAEDLNRGKRSHFLLKQVTSLAYSCFECFPIRPVQFGDIGGSLVKSFHCGIVRFLLRCGGSLGCLNCLGTSLTGFNAFINS